MTKKTLDGNTCAGNFDLATFLRCAKGVEFAVFIQMWPDHFDNIDAAHDEMLDLILACLKQQHGWGVEFTMSVFAKEADASADKTSKRVSPSRCVTKECAIFKDVFSLTYLKKKDKKWREKPSRSASICFLCRILESSASCLRHTSWMYVVLGLIKQTCPPIYQMDSHMNSCL